MEFRRTHLEIWPQNGRNFRDTKFLIDKVVTDSPRHLPGLQCLHRLLCAWPAIGQLLVMSSDQCVVVGISAT